MMITCTRQQPTKHWFTCEACQKRVGPVPAGWHVGGVERPSSGGVYEEEVVVLPAGAQYVQVPKYDTLQYSGAWPMAGPS